MRDQHRFSEDQLQILANIEIYDLTGAMPIIPSRHEENKLGWDTGFRFPWLKTSPIRNRACNFFLQYKISDYKVGTNSMHWSSWGAPHFRFDMAHVHKGVKLFHQRNTLIDLAGEDYPVAYVTNHVVLEADLIKLFKNRYLAHQLPVLWVTPKLRKHQYVTFDKSGTYFRLHSEDETLQKTSLIRLLDEQKSTEIWDDLRNIKSIVQRYESAAQIIGSSFREEYEQYQRKENFSAMAYLLSFYLRTYLNTHWYRIFYEPTH